MISTFICLHFGEVPFLYDGCFCGTWQSIRPSPAGLMICLLVPRSNDRGVNCFVGHGRVELPTPCLSSKYSKPTELMSPKNYFCKSSFSNLRLQYFLLQYLFRCNNGNFNNSTQWQVDYLYGFPGRVLPLKKTGINLIHSTIIINVSEKNGAFYNV